ncbi:hypothetical protein [Companilactobacillus mishanensis]|uniref:YolD-like family protein n=1 Tax=Companilactobacillus mishanensis TaxID=2486008 RepID=A0A5P0ZJN0_9LACO|nr:hypothetical protein [Companilactobacillus mishanensis]MQS52867.1 hypothetical protein [Companilactobacillus mishanensis]
MDEKKLTEKNIFNDASSYDDIMDLPYRQSKRHLPMNQRDRAFQFAPFGALEGFNDLIKEKTEMYKRRKYADGELEAKVATQIKYLQTHLDLKVDVTFFNDESGFYEHVKDTLTRVEYEKGRAIFGETSVVIAGIREIRLIKGN